MDHGFCQNLTQKSNLRLTTPYNKVRQELLMTLESLKFDLPNSNYMVIMRRWSWRANHPHIHTYTHTQSLLHQGAQFSSEGQSFEAVTISFLTETAVVGGVTKWESPNTIFYIAGHWNITLWLCTAVNNITYTISICYKAKLPGSGYVSLPTHSLVTVGAQLMVATGYGILHRVSWNGKFDGSLLINLSQVPFASDLLPESRGETHYIILILHAI